MMVIIVLTVLVVILFAALIYVNNWWTKWADDTMKGWKKAIDALDTETAEKHKFKYALNRMEERERTFSEFLSLKGLTEEYNKFKGGKK